MLWLYMMTPLIAKAFAILRCSNKIGSMITSNKAHLRKRWWCYHRPLFLLFLSQNISIVTHCLNKNLKKNRVTNYSKSSSCDQRTCYLQLLPYSSSHESRVDTPILLHFVTTEESAHHWSLAPVAMATPTLGITLHCFSATAHHCRRHLTDPTPSYWSVIKLSSAARLKTPSVDCRTWQRYLGHSRSRSSMIQSYLSDRSRHAYLSCTPRTH